jgi:hypothetical protein
VTASSIRRKDFNVQFQILTQKVMQIGKKNLEIISTVLENTIPLCKAYSSAKNPQYSVNWKMGNI